MFAEEVRKMTGKFKYMSYTADMKPLVTFELDTVDGDWLDRIKDKVLEITIEVFRKKRSLNANAYMWVLVGKIAEEIGVPEIEVYQKAILDVGVHRDWHGLTEEDETTLKALWARQGKGWFSERLDYEPDGEHIILRTYYGSSVYNTKQMSRLID